MTDRKEYLDNDLVKRKSKFLESNICPHCDHTEISKQGNNIFVTDYYVGDYGILGDQKKLDNPSSHFHHREEIECKCHCHKRFID